jgi:hypothetical protein
MDARNPALKREADAGLLAATVTITVPGESATVQSQSQDKIYHVNIKEQTCECPDFEHRGTYCKHLQAVDQHIMLQESQEKKEIAE